MCIKRKPRLRASCACGRAVLKAPTVWFAHPPSARLLPACPPARPPARVQGQVKWAWQNLGHVMLAITGTEALFADMGHFSAPAIRLSFSAAVYPCLVRGVSFFLVFSAFIILTNIRLCDASSSLLLLLLLLPRLLLLPLLLGLSRSLVCASWLPARQRVSAAACLAARPPPMRGRHGAPADAFFPCMATSSCQERCSAAAADSKPPPVSDTPAPDTSCPAPVPQLLTYLGQTAYILQAPADASAAFWASQPAPLK